MILVYHNMLFYWLILLVQLHSARGDKIPVMDPTDPPGLPGPEFDKGFDKDVNDNQVDIVQEKCGGWLNGTKGYIQTPNFPYAFQVPISCRWIIHAPPGHKIVLRFTQLYVKSGFKVNEYDHYQNEAYHIGKTDLGKIGQDWYALRTYKPYATIDFQVDDMHDIHYRVKKFFLDVYGFNITYEIVPENEPPKPTCSAHICSFLGNCIADRTFSNYRCRCFEEYFGDYCEYGPHCDLRYQNRNLCLNGGKCRYIMGSEINTCICAPGYDGNRCEKRMVNFVPKECEDVGCNHKCIRSESGSLQCACHEGYKLKSDNITCIEKGQMRFNVSAMLDLAGYRNRTGRERPECSNQMMEIEIHNKVRNLMKENIQAFSNFTVFPFDNAGENTYLHFYFIGEKEEQQKVWTTVYQFFDEFLICGVSMKHGVFYPYPVLRFVSLQNYGTKPVREGKLLTLSCKVKGSQSVQFTWYKDGALVNPERTARDMWETRTSTDLETHISVLTISKAHHLDAGDYSCFVSDWGLAETKSVYVDIVPIPHMEIEPLSATVHQGRPVTITCLSRDDQNAKFTYNWYRDGNIIKSATSVNSEFVEAISPTGSKLNLRSVHQSAVYTCVITSETGEVRGQSRVSVIRRNSSLCLGERSMGVKWQTTVGGTADVQRCPRSTVGIPEELQCRGTEDACGRNLRISGQASRRCDCDSAKHCAWLKPNFGKCRSIAMDIVRQEVETILLGFEVNDTQSEMRRLQDFLRYQESMSAPFGGDVETSMEVLWRVQEYLHKFGIERSGLTRPEEILTFADEILVRGKSMSASEKQGSVITAYLMKLVMDLGFDTSLESIVQHDFGHVNSRTFDLMMSLFPGKDNETLRLQSKSHNHGAVNITLHGFKDPTNGTFVSTSFNDVSDLLPPLGSSMHYTYNSALLFVGVEKKHPKRQYITESPMTIIFNHTAPISIQESENNSVCAAWEFTNFPDGRWSVSECQVLETTRTYTKCRCVWPGHYIVLTPAVVQQEVGPLFHEIHIAVVVGCVLSAIIFIITSVIYVIYWRSVAVELRYVRLQITVTLLVCCVLAVAGVVQPVISMACRVLSIILHQFYLAAMCFLVVEAARLYMLCTEYSKSRQLVCLDNAFGWVIPIVAMLTNVIANYVSGFNCSKGQLGCRCCLSYTELEYITFISPAAGLLIVYTVLISLTIKFGILHLPPEQKQDKRKHTYYTSRSVITMILLCAIIVTSVAISLSEDTVYLILFTAFTMLLAVFSMCMSREIYVYKALDQLENIGRTRCWGHLLTIAERITCICKQQDSDFKTYLKPEAFRHNIETEFQEIMERDKKYTREKKEQLSALLGSSSSEGSQDSEITICSNTQSESSGALELFSSTPYRNVSYISSERHHVNNLCACDRCGTVFPYKPSRGRSYLLEHDDDQIDLNAYVEEECEDIIPEEEPPIANGNSQNGGPNSHHRERYGGPRLSLPNPFPELLNKKFKKKHSLQSGNNNGDESNGEPSAVKHSSTGSKEGQVSYSKGEEDVKFLPLARNINI